MSFIDNMEKVLISVDGSTVEAVAGSFNGVPFFVESYTQGGGGRSVIQKKIPFSDKSVSEDVGGNTPTHSLSIYLVGNDCEQQKARLLKACSVPGERELVHPWLGKFMARCYSLSFSGSKESLGYIRGSITLTQESGIAKAPANKDLRGMANAAALNSVAIAKASFASSVDLKNKVKTTVDKCVAFTETAMNSIQSARRSMDSSFEFVSELGEIRANARALLMKPDAYAERVASLIAITSEVVGGEKNSNKDVNEFLTLMNFSIDEESFKETKELSKAIVSLVCNAAASAVVSSIVDCKFASVDDALDAQRMITESFDKLLENTDNVEQYIAIGEMQSLALGYLREAMANMAIVVEREITATTNVVTLCYELYDNVDRIDEIIERNLLKDGLFVMPGKVKVLNK